MITGRPDAAGQPPPHPLFAAAAIGQVVEWLVWAHLVSSSRGRLRIFLPARDMGIDGIAHRPATDDFVALQVKGRSRLEEGVLRVHVQEDEVRQPDTVVVVVVVDLTTNTLREPALVMTAQQLHERAHLVQWGPRRAYAITVPYPPGSRTHWADLCVPLAEVAERVAPVASIGDGTEESAATRAATDQGELAATGYIGEMALVHQASLSPRLNVFHAAPDMGFDEYLIRHIGTGGIAAFQVKCIEVSDAQPSGLLHLPVRTISTSARAWLAVFVRHHNEDVRSPVLLVPARDIPSLAHHVSDDYLHITVNPARLGPLEPYAHRLQELPATLEQIVGNR